MMPEFVLFEDENNNTWTLKRQWNNNYKKVTYSDRRQLIALANKALEREELDRLAKEKESRKRAIARKKKAKTVAP